jgi:hypothetical protein
MSSMTDLNYNPANLLSDRDFFNYCADHGVIFHHEDLEVFHKQGLLIPILRLSRGVNKYRKILVKVKFTNQDGQASWREEWQFVAIGELKKFQYEELDKKTYYQLSGLDRTDPNWLEWYKKRGMVKFLAKVKFKPWPQEPFVGFTTNQNDINDTIYFYQQYQFLLLKEIFRLRETHEISGSEYAKKETDKILKNQVKQFNNFIDFYLEVDDYQYRLILLIDKERKEFLTSYLEVSRQAKKDWKKHFDSELRPMLKDKLNSILKKHHIVLGDIEYWQYWLAGKTLLGNPVYASAVRRRYLSGIDEKTLVKAEEANRMIFVLNQIIYLLTGEKRTVNQVFGDSQGNRCVICHRLFEPTKKLQYTCGEPKCTRKYQNQLKRQNRKIGKYKPR